MTAKERAGIIVGIVEHGSSRWCAEELVERHIIEAENATQVQTIERCIAALEGKQFWCAGEYQQVLRNLSTSETKERILWEAL